MKQDQYTDQLYFSFVTANDKKLKIKECHLNKHQKYDIVGNKFDKRYVSVY